jgi:hypothetical protein
MAIWSIVLVSFKNNFFWKLLKKQTVLGSKEFVNFFRRIDQNEERKEQNGEIKNGEKNFNEK